MTVLDRGEWLYPRRSPSVRGQSQGRFPAAPENLLVANVGELLWEFQNNEGVVRYWEIQRALVCRSCHGYPYAVALLLKLADVVAEWIQFG
jgi:hypothetical protein